MTRAALIIAVVARIAWAAPNIGAAVAVTPSGPMEGQRQARLAAGSTEFLAVWEAGVGARASIRAARIGLDGVSLDPSGFTVSSGAGGRFEPAVAFGHGVYVVVWSDMRDGDHALRAARITPQGQVLDVSGVLLSNEPTAARMADVAATPDGFVVAWAQAADRHGFTASARRFGPDLTAIDAAPLHLTASSPWTFGEDWQHAVIYDLIAQHFRVAIAGNVAVVLWGGTTAFQQGYFIVSAQLDVATGAVTQPASVAVIGAQSRIYHPAVCELGQHFLYAWTDFRERGGQGLDSANFGVLSVDGGSVYGPLDSTSQPRIVWTPAVTHSGWVAFVEPWADPNRQNRFEYHLMLRQVIDDATSPGADQQVEPQAAWPALATHANGSTLLVYTLVNTPGMNGRLRARLISP